MVFGEGMYGFDEGGEFGEFRVFLAHGGSPLYKEVERFIQEELEMPTVAMDERIRIGPTHTELLDDQTDPCEYVIFVLTAEDRKGPDRETDRRRILHEIGFCQGKFGLDRVLVLKQDGIEEFPEVSGIEYESFPGKDIASVFAALRAELETAKEEFESEQDEDVG